LVIAGAHPGWSRGANGGGFARRRFHSETVAGVVSETVAGDPEDHPVPVRRPLGNALISRHLQGARRHHVRKTILRAFSAIICCSTVVAPNESNSGVRAADGVRADGLMAQMPPGLPVSVPRSRPSGHNIVLPGHSNTSQDTPPRPSGQKLTAPQASLKLERARSSAPQLSRACNDTKQADSMRWLGENHNSTALISAI
jgi:hypothetical protein